MKITPVHAIKSNLLRRLSLVFWVIAVIPVLLLCFLIAQFLNLWDCLFGSADFSFREYLYRDYIFVKGVVLNWYVDDLPAMWRASSCQSQS